MKQKAIIKKAISMLLSAAIFTQMLASFPASAESAESKIPQIEWLLDSSYGEERILPIILGEDISRRGEYEKHFLCDDGSYIAASYQEPVHMLVDGAWVNINFILSADSGRIISSDENSQISLTQQTGADDENSIVSLNANGYEITRNIGIETLYDSEKPVEEDTIEEEIEIDEPIISEETAEDIVETETVTDEEIAIEEEIAIDEPVISEETAEDIVETETVTEEEIAIEEEIEIDETVISEEIAEDIVETETVTEEEIAIEEEIEIDEPVISEEIAEDIVETETVTDEEIAIEEEIEIDEPVISEETAEDIVETETLTDENIAIEEENNDASSDNIGNGLIEGIDARVKSTSELKTENQEHENHISIEDLIIKKNEVNDKLKETAGQWSPEDETLIAEINALIAESNQHFINDVSFAQSEVEYPFALGENTTLRYTLSRGKVKEEVIFANRDEITAYTVSMNASGLKLILQEDNSILLIDENEELTAVIEPPTVFDASHTHAEDINLSVEQFENEYLITCTPSSLWLDEAERVYPITIQTEIKTLASANPSVTNISNKDPEVLPEEIVEIEEEIIVSETNEIEETINFDEDEDTSATNEADTLPKEERSASKSFKKSNFNRFSENNSRGRNINASRKNPKYNQTLNSLSDELFVGYDEETDTEYQTLWKPLVLPTIPEDAVITSASFNFQLDVGATASSLELHKAETPWDGDTVTWETKPEVTQDTFLGASNQISDDTLTFDATQAVIDWYSGGDNHGFVIKAGTGKLVNAGCFNNTSNSCTSNSSNSSSSSSHTHNYSSTVKSATCTTAGTKKCCCGVTTSIPATGVHNYVGSSCTMCGKANPAYSNCSNNGTNNGNNGTVTVSYTLVLELYSVTIPVNESKKINIKTISDYLKSKTAVWTSRDNAIATVDKNGNVIGKKIGTTSIELSFTEANGSVIKDSNGNKVYFLCQVAVNGSFEKEYLDNITYTKKYLLDSSPKTELWITKLNDGSFFGAVIINDNYSELLYFTPEDVALMEENYKFVKEKVDYNGERFANIICFAKPENYNYIQGWYLYQGRKIIPSNLSFASNSSEYILLWYVYSVVFQHCEEKEIANGILIKAVIEAGITAVLGGIHIKSVSRSITKSITLSETKAISQSTYYIPAGTKPIRLQSAEMANAELKSGGTYTNPACKPGTYTTIVETNTKVNAGTYVRVITDGKTGIRGQWFMLADDIKGLSATQIQQKYALEHTPTHIYDVVLEKGTKFRASIANNIYGQPGGGLQFDFMSVYAGEFINARKIS